ncbi:MAG: phosphodiester glycosidase family protein [Verrucomicrobiae bacterium]|nr:phosphodiester glycosidase family protein [Verrucomicrobiae bacterium]
MAIDQPMAASLRSIRRFVIGCVGLGLLGSHLASADSLTTEHPFPGVLLYSEVRTNPPQRLFVAEIDLTNPQLRLGVAPGGADPDGPGPWQTTLMRPTQIAMREKFDLVVNGDFFSIRRTNAAGAPGPGFRPTVWSSVSGPAMSAGQLWSPGTGERPALVVDRAGRVSIRPLQKPGANDWQIISGNVMLVQAGKVVKHNNQARHPRTVAGLNQSATKLILLVVDGRKPGVARGMSYAELAQEILARGGSEALNLDGGGSSVLAVRDPDQNTFRILNQPSDGRERAVANVLGLSVSPRPNP